MSKDNMYKFMGIMLIIGMVLCLQQSMVLAIDREQAEKLTEQIKELAASDPELAREVEKELEAAVKDGGIELEREAAEVVGKELGIREPGKDIVGGYGDKDYKPRVDPDKVAKRAEELMKQGLDPKAIDEKLKAEFFKDEMPGRGGFDRPMPSLDTEKGRAEALKTFDLEKGRMLDEGFTKDEVAKIEKALKEGHDPSELFRDKFEKEGAVLGERGGGYEMYREKGGTEAARDWVRDRGFGEGRPDFIKDVGGKEFEKMDKEQMEKSFKEFMSREPTKEERGNMERGLGREPMHEMDEKQAKEFAHEGMDRAKETYREMTREMEGRAKEEVGREMMKEAEHAPDREVARETMREAAERPEMAPREIERPEVQRAEIERQEKSYEAPVREYEAPSRENWERQYPQ